MWPQQQWHCRADTNCTQRRTSSPARRLAAHFETRLQRSTRAALLFVGCPDHLATTHPSRFPPPPPTQICDINGNCVDAAEDEVFKLTTREGQLVVEAEKVGGCWAGAGVVCWGLGWSAGCRGGLLDCGGMLGAG